MTASIRTSLRHLVCVVWRRGTARAVARGVTTALVALVVVWLPTAEAGQAGSTGQAQEARYDLRVRVQRAPGNDGLSDVTVTVRGRAGVAGEGTTDDDGDVVVGDLLRGSYVVEFEGPWHLATTPQSVQVPVERRNDDALVDADLTVDMETNWTVWFLLLIALVFFGALVALTLPLVARIWQLGSLRRQIIDKSGDRRSGPVCTVFDLEPATRQQLEADLTERSWTQAFWTPFLTQWNDLRDEGQKRAAEPLHFLDFCTPGRVIPGMANRRLATVVPGMLVALGILGTFFGLYLGLPEAAQLQGTQGQQTIQNLIVGLRTAFQTSLFGIAASLVFLFLDRLTFHGLERGVTRLGEAVDQLYPSAAAAVVRRDQARELSEATGQLKSLGTTIAQELENSLQSVMRDAVAEAMAQEVAPAVKQLNDVVGTLNKAVSQDMVAALQSFSGEINKNISGALQESFSELTDNVQLVVASQEQIRDLLTTAAERMQEQASIQEKLASQLIASADALQGVLAGLHTVSTNLAAAAALVSEATTQLSTVSTETSTVHQQVVAAQQQLSERMTHEFEQLMEARQDILSGWQAITSDAAASIDIIREASRTLGEQVEGRLDNALKMFDEKLAEVTERFGGTLHLAAETIHELPTLLTQMTESSASMSEASSGLASTLRDVAEDMRTSVGDAAERTVAAAGELATVTETSGEVAKQFSGTIAQYQAALPAETKRFTVLSDELSACTKELQALVVALQEQRAAAKTEGEQTTERLSGLTDELSACTKELQALVPVLQEQSAAGKTAGEVALAGLTDTLAKVLDALREVVAREPEQSIAQPVAGEAARLPAVDPRIDFKTLVSMMRSIEQQMATLARKKRDGGRPEGEGRSTRPKGLRDRFRRLFSGGRR